MKLSCPWTTACLLAMLAACLGDDETPPDKTDIGGASYVKNYEVDGANFLVASAAASSDGGQYLLGTVHTRAGAAESGSPGGRLALLSTDASGDLRWARVYEEAGQPGVFSNLADASEAPDGSIWVAGSRQGQARVVRLDAEGVVGFTVDYGSAEVPVRIKALRATADRGFIAAGTVPGSAPESSVPQGGDLWLLKANAAGEQEQLHISDGEPKAAEVPGDLRVGADGEVTVVGSQGALYYKDDFWIAHFRSDLRPAFAETYTGITLSGSAQAVLSLPRVAGSNVARAGLVAVGSSRGSRDGNGLGVASRSRLVYVDLPDGEQRQDEDVDVLTEEDATYVGVAAWRDPNSIIAVGSRDVIVVLPGGGERLVRRGFLQQLARQPSGGGADAGRFTSERILTMPELSPSLTDDFQPLELASVDGGYFLLGGSNPAVFPVQAITLIALDANLRERWARPVSGLVPDTVGSVNRLVPTRDGGLLLVTTDTLVRLDAAGGLRWSRKLAAESAPVSLGRPRAVTALGQGGALVLTEGGAALRYAADGSLLFARRLDGLELGAATEVDRDGDGLSDALLLAGSRLDGSRVYTRLVRLRTDGGVIDVRELAGAPRRGASRAISRGGGRLLLTLEDGMLWLDAAGLPVQRWLGAPTGAAAATADGVFWRSLRTSFDAPGLNGSVVARYGYDGAPRWARRLELLPPGIDAGSDAAGTVQPSEQLLLSGLAVSSDGGLTVTGSMRRPSGGVCNSAPERNSLRAEGVDEFGLAAIRCSDGLIVRLDAEGAPRWQRSFGTVRDEALELGDAVADNGALAAGGSYGFAFPSLTGLVVRADADGQVGGSCVASAPLTTALRSVDVQAEPFAVQPALSTVVEISSAELPVTRLEPLKVTVARACSGAVGTPLLQVAVVGDGRVTEDASSAVRAGISCPGDCDQRHTTGVLVPLVAVPAAGGAFVGWEGDCASFGSQPSVRVPMDRSRTCTARFQQRQTTSFAVAVTLEQPTSASGNRVYSLPDAIECSTPVTGSCTARFDTSTPIRLEAVAGPDQRFAGWTGCDTTDTTSTPVCTVRGDRGDRRITARFEQVAVLSLTVALAEPGGSRSNRVISFPAGIDCQSGDTGECTVRVREGTASVALTPMAEVGQRFAGWLGCESVSTAVPPQCFVTVRAGSRNVTAQFEAAPESRELRVVFEGRPQLDDDGSAATDRVLSNFGGISCDASGMVCAARYTQGSEVRLTLELDPTLSRAGFRSRLDRWLECDLLEPADPGQPPTCVLRQLNRDTEITVRVRYIDDESFDGAAPTARVAITGQRTPEPNTVDEPARFDARGSSAEAGRRIIAYEWDWNADGAYDCAQTEADSGQCITTAILPFGVAEHQYTRRGVATVGMRITDDVGRQRTLLRTFNVR